MWFRISYLVIVLLSCNPANDDKHAIAANEEVERYLTNFEGRGALADSSELLTPEQSLKLFRIAHDIEIDLVLSEPQVLQPVNINFDPRGRLWAVQYNQYPYPKGVKITKIDEHLRSEFDKQLLPPPQATKGADKITFFEDTNNDGTYDKSTDAITGLNIATSVAFGRNKIWVLNPPYLLAYDDKNSDGLPEGDPVVALKGFGLQDTHAVANSLTFGPDGWLYGAQGSTVHSTVSSDVTTNVHFKGQAIWRYHPFTKVFEIFAEGGGNTFHIEIDSKGRIYSGDNGTDRGQYYKQGAYYVKNLGKHGLHTNPYTFGHLANMKLTGDKLRFTHGFIRYEGGALPARYNDRMLAINPLQNYVQLSRFESNGSSFANVDEERILETNDKWFRPVDIKLGPDGYVYIADWSDSRLTHIDPRDNWHKKSGRIYVIRPAGSKPTQRSIDIGSSSDDELIAFLEDKNKWYRQQAIQEFANRQNEKLVPRLLERFENADGNTALELLWAINASGGFTDEFATEALQHSDPFVRMWAVRLIGDNQSPSANLKQALVRLASTEQHPEVRSQLLASGKRLDGSSAIAIAGNILKSNDDSNDPDLPLQTWWLLESKSISYREEILKLFADKKIWFNNVVQHTILERLMQRYYKEGGDVNTEACVALLKFAPSAQMGAGLIRGLEKSIQGRNDVVISSAMMNVLKKYERHFPDELLLFQLRTGDSKAFTRATSIINNLEHDTGRRIKFIKTLGETGDPKAIPWLLQAFKAADNRVIRAETLAALQHFDTIANDVLREFQARFRKDSTMDETVLMAFAARPSWSKTLLDAVEQRTIDKEVIPAELVSRLKLLKDRDVVQRTTALWPAQHVTADQKTVDIKKVSGIIAGGRGDVEKGKKVYSRTCGGCHKLFGEGGNMGPDLTGYDRTNLNDLLTNIIDPDAYIREGFVNHTIHTKDGRTISGLLRSHTEQYTTIQPFGGSAVTLPASAIKELVAERASLMPAGLISGMKDDEVRSLFTYIMQ